MIMLVGLREDTIGALGLSAERREALGIPRGSPRARDRGGPSPSHGRLLRRPSVELAHVGRFEIEAVLAHVSFRNVLAVIPGAGRPDPFPEIRRPDLGLGVEDVLEPPAAMTPDRAVAGPAGNATEDVGSRDCGIARAGPRCWSCGPGPIRA